MRRPLVYIALFFMGTVLFLDAFLGVKLYDEGKLAEHEGESLKVSGVVQSFSQKNPEHVQMIVKVGDFNIGAERINISDAPEKLLVNIYGNTTEDNTAGGRDLCGREVSVSGEISLPEPRRNPGTFDYRQYLKTREIYAVMKAEPGSLHTGEVKDAVRNTAGKLREGFIERLGAQTDKDTAALADAMLFGDKSGLDEEQYERFRMNGTAHILAVSGLHIGAVYGLITLLWRGRKRWAFAIFTSLFFIFYCFLADFSPSVVRAVIMIMLHLVSKLIYRRYDILTAAALTAVMVLAVCPMQIYNTGFQMSFLAVMVISALTPLLGKGPAGKAAFAVFFQAVMLPYTAYTFNYVSLGAFFINIPVIMIAGIMVPAGVVMMFMTNLIPEPLWEALSGLFTGCSDLLTKINDSAYRPGTLCFDAVSPRLWVVLLFYAGFFILVSEMFLIMKSRKRWGRIFYITALTVIISAGAGSFADDTFRDADIVFVDVGQGSCVHIRMPAGEDILIDGGGKVSFGKTREEREKYEYDVGKKVLRPYLLKNGVRKVDLAMVTHLDADHYKGIASLCRLGMVEKLGLHECLRDEEEKVVQDTGMKREDIVYIRTGEKIETDGFELKVIAPLEGNGPANVSGESREKNANSMVSKVVFQNKKFFGNEEMKSALITGDIDEKTEAELVSRYGGKKGGVLDCDILAVPHHGSRYSSSEAFIKAVSPSAAVIQVGENTYGHPAAEVIKRYENTGCRVYRNDEQGAVGLFRKKIRTTVE